MKKQTILFTGMSGYLGRNGRHNGLKDTFQEAINTVKKMWRDKQLGQ